ncbi:hypothetical protein [Vibrio variabilis]|uniref:hypothetical protein n=1 Tax=Vibrio variabilis TaxID=990271 RepID=UPI000DD9A6CB|nr:hypothetical protein [Vibrio variabilis]
MSKLLSYLSIVLIILVATFHPKALEDIIGFDMFENIRIMIREMEAGFDKLTRALRSATD